MQARLFFRKRCPAFALRYLAVLALSSMLVHSNVRLNRTIQELAGQMSKRASVHRSANAVKEIVAALREAESAQRGYLLSGNEKYLKAYQHGLVRLSNARGNPAFGVHRWMFDDAFRKLVAEKVSEMDMAIGLERSGNHPKALDVALSGQALATMENIERKELACSIYASLAIKRQQVEHNRSTQNLQTTIICSYGLAVCLLACAALLFKQELGKRSAIEDALRAQESELTDRLEQRTTDLKASELRYRAMLEQSPLAVHILDLAGNSLHVNSAFEKLAGVTAAAMKGYNIWADPQPFLQGTRGLLQKAYSGHAVAIGPILHVPALSNPTALGLSSGSEAWVELIAYPIKDADGQILELVLLCNDVTDRETALLSVRESEAKFKQLTDAVPQLVWTAKPDGKVDYYNQRWQSYFDLFGGGELQWERLIHPDDFALTFEQWHRCVESQSPFEYEFRLWSPRQEEYRWHLGRAIPFRTTNGQLERWFGTSTDIHDRKEAEETMERRVLERTSELQASYELLRARENDLRISLAQRDLLFHEVHHRVKNNLQVISSLLRMQASTLLGVPAASIALEESRKRILSMSMIHERLYAGPGVDRIDFSEYTETLVKQLIYSCALPGKQIQHIFYLEKVQLNVEQAIPCGLILNELVTNAIKHAFTSRNTGEIRVYLQQDSQGAVELRVEDNGVGLPAGFNWKASTSLGLPIVDVLAGQLEGFVTYREQQGARFTVAFRNREIAGNNISI